MPVCIGASVRSPVIRVDCSGARVWLGKVWLLQKQFAVGWFLLLKALALAPLLVIWTARMLCGGMRGAQELQSTGRDGPVDFKGVREVHQHCMKVEDIVVSAAGLRGALLRLPRVIPQLLFRVTRMCCNVVKWNSST